MSRVSFFASQSDLCEVLTYVEAKVSVKYVLCERYTSEQFTEYVSFQDLPNLGVASGESTVKCDSYLVVPIDSQVVPEIVNSGTMPRNPRIAEILALVSRKPTPDEAKQAGRYVVNQMNNPDSVVLNCGGQFGEGILIAGELATISTSPFAQKTMRVFRNAMKKISHQIGIYCVATEAYRQLQDGARLTVAVQSPSVYDLKRP